MKPTSLLAFAGRHKRQLPVLLLLLVSLVLVVNRFVHTRPAQAEGHPRDWTEIQASGILHATTEYNSLSYHVEGDTLSGFHYELVHAFARSHGLQVDVVPLMSFEQRLEGLQQGRFDLIAYNLLSTSQLKDTLALTIPLMSHKQVIVQRKAQAEDSVYIHSQLDLAHRTLHVVKGSPALLRIHNLSNEIGDTIYTREVERYGQEQLLAMVAHGDIDYAVADESLARSMLDSFPQLDISTDLSFNQFYAWGVSKQQPELLRVLNEWLQNYLSTPEYKKLYRKYYAGKKPVNRKKPNT